MIKDFNGKVVVITGGASGIGRGLAFAFAKRGMKIVLADIDKENLEKVAKELEQFDTEVMTQITDVSDPEQVAHLSEVSYDRFGSINVLCNNAGVGGGGPLRFLTNENWNWTLGVNLFGVIYGIRYFLDRMIKSKVPCHIVNISSMSGLFSGANTQPYPASKFAVVAISESLAQECVLQRTKVGVSVVCPGNVNTNIAKNSYNHSQKRPDLWRPPAINKQSEPIGENTEIRSTSGMDPEEMAEIVIMAIKKNILYVLTHPEYIPLVKSRFENIYDDTFKLHGSIEEKPEIRSKVFKNETPAFSFTYPADLLDSKTNPSNRSFPIFIASKVPGFNIQVFVARSSSQRIEKAAQKMAKYIKRTSSEVKIISNEPINLNDGTPAYEHIIDYKLAGIHKKKMVSLSTFKDGHRIQVNIVAVANYYKEYLRDILRSFKFN